MNISEPTPEQWAKWYAHKSNKEIFIENEERKADMDDNSDIEKEKELEDEGQDLDRQVEIFNNEY